MMMDTLDLQPPQTDLPEHLHRISPEKARADVSVGVRERIMQNFLVQLVGCYLDGILKFYNWGKTCFKLYLPVIMCRMKLASSFLMFITNAHQKAVFVVTLYAVKVA